jgi:hypothetical protein
MAAYEGEDWSLEELEGELQLTTRKLLKLSVERDIRFHVELSSQLVLEEVYQSNAAGLALHRPIIDTTEVHKTRKAQVPGNMLKDIMEHGMSPMLFPCPRGEKAIYVDPCKPHLRAANLLLTGEQYALLRGHLNLSATSKNKFEPMKIAVQQAARDEWEENPTYTQKQVVGSDRVDKALKSLDAILVPRTILKYVQEVDPRADKRHRGGPKKAANI